MSETTKSNNLPVKKVKSSHAQFHLEEYLIPGEIYGAYYPGNVFFANDEEFFPHEAFKTTSIEGLKIDDLMLVLNVEVQPPSEESHSWRVKVTVLSLSLGKPIIFYWPKGKSCKTEFEQRFPPLNIVCKAKALQDLKVVLR